MEIMIEVIEVIAVLSILGLALYFGFCGINQIKFEEPEEFINTNTEEDL